MGQKFLLSLESANEYINFLNGRIDNKLQCSANGNGKCIFVKSLALNEHCYIMPKSCKNYMKYFYESIN